MFFSASRLWFNFVNSNFLVYNICWEDVEIDKELLQIKEDSNLLMISSAGCNALTYLLDAPNSIETVDINPHQTALLELKIAVIKHGHYPLFEELFARGKSPRIQEMYSTVSPLLSRKSRAYWDSHLRFFNPEGKGFFLQGGSGYFARFLNRIIDRKGIRDHVLRLFDEPDASIRKTLFEELEQKLWNGAEQNLWVSGGILGLAGIPASQRKAIGDMNAFMKNALFNVFVNQSAKDNPYWNAYIFGEIPKEAYPGYLEEGNFEILRSRIDSIEFSTSSFRKALQNSNKTYSHFVLLDHMDWMVGGQQNTLRHQWKLLLERGKPGTQILFRTAHKNLNFIPGFVFDKVKFSQVDPGWIANQDRVGTYTGTYLGTIR